MSYAGNVSDVEQEKNISDFRPNRSTLNLVAKSMSAKPMMDVVWNDKRRDQEDSDSEISDSGNFLAKGELRPKILCVSSFIKLKQNGCDRCFPSDTIS